MEASVSTTDQFGRFRSPALPPTATSGQCMSFWYHMYGRNIGALRVLLQSIDGNTDLTLWDYGSNVGDVWNAGQVPVNSSVNFWVS